MAVQFDMLEGREDRSSFARWVVPALLVSLLLHAMLYHWAGMVTVRGMSTAYYDTIVPRTFRIERVEIDPALLEPEPSRDPVPAMAPQPVKLPEERISFERLMGGAPESAAAPPIPQPSEAVLPSDAPPGLAATLEAAEASGAQSLLEDTRSLLESLLTDKPSPNALDLPEDFAPDAFAASTLAPPGTPPADGAHPGFSNLDNLLASTGPLTPETAPILMPTDLLFDYDSDQMRIEAVESLAKLGTLIGRNPQATFLIEGHTDSFGSDAYNLELSTRRAGSVRDWLILEMGIPPERLEIRGLGKSRLIAPPTGTIEDQQINRRVEIVIRAAGE
jgi:outer membrane protein OmpA-like peptidoglycan-associated protein